MQDAHRATSRLCERFALRTPRGLIEAIEAAARAHHIAPSEYARQAILGALRADGVYLTPEGTVERADRGVAA
jgi:hypothetical protein